MPPETHPIELDMPPPEAMVEFGAAPAPRRRWSATGFGRSMLADRRLVPVTAVLAAVALLASLVSEWQVTTVDPTIRRGDDASRMLSTGVTDVGAFGTAYLVGLFPLVVAVVLTMFGPPGGRRYARLTGLSIGGTLFALLFAATTSLGGDSRIITQIYTIELEDDQMKVGYGRGLWCAYAGVLLALAVLYLTERHLPAGPPTAGQEEPAAVWSWRRPPVSPDEHDPDEPLGLTVAPAKPFTSLRDDRAKPS
jgi:hypothetical protein